MPLLRIALSWLSCALCTQLQRLIVNLASRLVTRYAFVTVRDTFTPSVELRVVVRPIGSVLEVDRICCWVSKLLFAAALGI